MKYVSTYERTVAYLNNNFSPREIVGEAQHDIQAAAKADPLQLVDSVYHCCFTYMDGGDDEGLWTDYLKPCIDSLLRAVPDGQYEYGVMDSAENQVTLLDDNFGVPVRFTEVKNANSTRITLELAISKVESIVSER